MHGDTRSDRQLKTPSPQQHAHLLTYKSPGQNNQPISVSSNPSKKLHLAIQIQFPVVRFVPVQFAPWLEISPRRLIPVCAFEVAAPRRREPRGAPFTFARARACVRTAICLITHTW